MSMIIEIYKRALAVLMKKPLKLWGLSLLCPILTGIVTGLFGLIPGVALAISMLFSTSMLMVYLRGYRGEEPHVVNLFDCFKDWNVAKRVILGLGWKSLWIVLWSLIPFVGWVFAIIRFYEYYLTDYILVQEPDIPLTEAINVSRERTRGYKFKIFLAQAALPVIAYILGAILFGLSMIPFIGILFGIVAFLFTLICVAFMPLVLGLIGAAFYEEISNPTMDASVPVFQAPAAPAAQPAAPAAFCPNCGAKNDGESAFCQNCGTRL